jgi:hypothetical protein
MVLAPLAVGLYLLARFSPPDGHRAWLWAIAVSQIALTSAALVLGPGSIVLRGLLLTASLAYGWMVGQILEAGGGMWLTLWLTMSGTVLASFLALRVGGLRLIEPGEYPADGASASAPPTSAGNGRQFSLAGLFSATLLVALLAAMLRYAAPPHGNLILAMVLLALGWGLMSVTCLLLVGLEGEFWMRLLLAALLIGFIVADTWLLDNSRGAPGSAFLQICTASLPILGVITLVIRCAGYALDWVERD